MIEPSSLDAGNAFRAADRDAQWPAADWWRAYDDPQLDAWLDAAQAGNPSLAAAQARVREALSMAGVARAALAPQVNGSLSIQRQKWADNVYYGPGPLAGEQSWNNTGTLATQADDTARSVAAAQQRNYDLSREGYRRGLTDYLRTPGWPATRPPRRASAITRARPLA